MARLVHGTYDVLSLSSQPLRYTAYKGNSLARWPAAKEPQLCRAQTHVVLHQPLPVNGADLRHDGRKRCPCYSCLSACCSSPQVYAVSMACAGVSSKWCCGLCPQLANTAHLVLQVLTPSAVIDAAVTAAKAHVPQASAANASPESSPTAEGASEGAPAEAALPSAVPQNVQLGLQAQQALQVGPSPDNSRADPD